MWIREITSIVIRVTSQHSDIPHVTVRRDVTTPNLPTETLHVRASNSLFLASPVLFCFLVHFAFLSACLSLRNIHDKKVQLTFACDFVRSGFFQPTKYSFRSWSTSLFYFSFICMLYALNFSLHRYFTHWTRNTQWCRMFLNN